MLEPAVTAVLAPPLLDVAELHKRFPVGRQGGGQRGWFTRAPGPLLHAVQDVTMTLARGEALGLVGESGCGKSTLARLLARLLDPSEGSIRLDGRELSFTPARRFAADPARARIQLVFQDAGESINPRFTAWDAIADPLRTLPGQGGMGKRGAALDAAVREAAELCGLPEALLGRFPHQLSGGQRARVGIARAVGPRPDLMILDEPTAALDVSVQVTVLKLLAELRGRLGMSYVFVSHDLNVVRLLCDRVAVMYLGRIVESGPAEDVFRAPKHPYTQALVAAAPSLSGVRRKVPLLPGEPRSPIDPSMTECAFAGRCPRAEDLCTAERPLLRRVGEGRVAACHFAEAA